MAMLGIALVEMSQLVRLLEQGIWPLLRISGMVLAAPVFAQAGVPTRVRALLTIALTIVVFPLLPDFTPPVLYSSTWWLALFAELALGIAFGFILRIAFESVSLCGELVSLSVGLGFAQLADPMRGGTASLMSRFYLMLATALFFALDGHLALVQLTTDSFREFAPGAATFSAEQSLAVVSFAGRAILTGTQLALPVMIAMLVTNLAFGLIGRAAPALNLLTVGLPIVLIMGIALAIVTLPTLLAPFRTLLDAAWQLIGR
jgi:flagellar biosynthesis protein FliR